MIKGQDMTIKNIFTVKDWRGNIVHFTDSEIGAKRYASNNGYDVIYKGIIETPYAEKRTGDWLTL